MEVRALVPGRQYLLLVTEPNVRPEQLSLAHAAYIDQAAADADGIVCFGPFLPSSATADQVFLCGGSGSPLLLGRLLAAGEKRDCSGEILFAASFQRVYDKAPQQLAADELAQLDGATAAGWHYTWQGVDATVYGPTDTPPTDAGRYTLTAAYTDETRSGVKTADFIILPQPLDAYTPTLRGRPYPGETLYADLPGADAAQLSWAWFRDGKQIAAAQGASYLLQTADARCTITARAGAANNNYSGSSALSAGLRILAAPAAGAKRTRQAQQAATPVSAALISSFPDVSETQWFFPYVAELSAAGVIDGYPDGMFRPQGTVTYGEALKLVLLAAGYAPQPAAAHSHWASGYLARAAADGLLGESIGLDAAIDRQSVAALAARALRLPAAAMDSPFCDTADADVLALYAAGIVTGSPTAAGGLAYRPRQSLTRAELSAVGWRIRQYGIEKSAS